MASQPGRPSHAHASPVSSQGATARLGRSQIRAVSIVSEAPNRPFTVVRSVCFLLRVVVKVIVRLLQYSICLFLLGVQIFFLFLLSVVYKLDRTEFPVDPGANDVYSPSRNGSNHEMLSRSELSSVFDVVMEDIAQRLTISLRWTLNLWQIVRFVGEHPEVLHQHYGPSTSPGQENDGQNSQDFVSHRGVLVPLQPQETAASQRTASLSTSNSSDLDNRPVEFEQQGPAYHITRGEETQKDNEESSRPLYRDLGTQTASCSPLSQAASIDPSRQDVEFEYKAAADDVIIPAASMQTSYQSIALLEGSSDGQPASRENVSKPHQKSDSAEDPQCLGNDHDCDTDPLRCPRYERRHARPKVSKRVHQEAAATDASNENIRENSPRGGAGSPRKRRRPQPQPGE